MSEMVERVARAICAGNVTYNGPKDTRTLEERISEEWQNWEPDARTVLQAMREPTEAMLDAGNDFWIGQSVRLGTIRMGYTDMIDAALEYPRHG